MIGELFAAHVFAIYILFSKDPWYLLGIFLLVVVGYASFRVFTNRYKAFVVSIGVLIISYYCWFHFRCVPYWGPQIRL